MTLYTQLESLQQEVQNLRGMVEEQSNQLRRVQTEQQQASEAKLSAWIAAEGTEWGDNEVPGMAEMVKNVEELRPKQEPDYYFAFGYNQARAMTAVLDEPDAVTVDAKALYDEVYCTRYGRFL